MSETTVKLRTTDGERSLCIRGEKCDRLTCRMSADVNALLAANRRLAEALTEVEWRGDRGGKWICSWCGESKTNGHIKACKLAAALAEGGDHA